MLNPEAHKVISSSYCVVFPHIPEAVSTFWEKKNAYGNFEGIYLCRENLTLGKKSIKISQTEF